MELIVVTTGGIGDRLTEMFAAERAAVFTKRKLTVFWRPDEACPCHFHELFISNTFTTFTEKRIKAPTIGTMPYPEMQEKLEKMKDETVVLHGFFGHNYKEFEKHVGPTPEIKKICEEFEKNYFKKPMLGVHIRRSDKIHPIHPKPNDWIGFVKKRPKEETIFLATDDGGHVKKNDIKTIRYDNIAQLFIKNFGNRVVRYPTRSLLRSDKNALFDAVVELFLLRLCDYLIIGNYSGFSKMAAEGKKFTYATKVNNGSICSRSISTRRRLQSY